MDNQNLNIMNNLLILTIGPTIFLCYKISLREIKNIN